MTIRKSTWYCALVLAALFTSFAFAGCSSDEFDDDIMNNINGTLNGANERPDPVTTDATGTITGTLNATRNILNYTVNWNDLTAAPVAMHFHGPAGVDEVAGPVVTVTGFPTDSTGTVTGTVNLTPTQKAQLMNGMWYFNIHTPNYPAGEIRGQVMVTR